MNSSTMTVRDNSGRQLRVHQLLDNRGELAGFQLDVNNSTIDLDLHDGASLAGFLSPAAITLARRPR